MLKNWQKISFLILTVLAFILHPILCQPAIAQPALSDVKPGCEKKVIDIQEYGGLPFQNPEEIKSQNGLLETTIEVKYGENKIAGCDVKLRSYNGKLVGPTLRIQSGDTLNINLINSLPPETNPSTPVNHNKPHAFNITNFHTHGLHVSPDGNSDNVLREMAPKKDLNGNSPEYPIEIKLPEIHPGGTDWYHSHFHGSTALQVSSGMAGALIVEGGLDRLPEIAAAKEKIFVLQQIAYNEKGELENYDDLKPNKWQQSQRQITINGQIVPTIEMQPGEVQHWRFIHAGIREGINLELRHVDDSRRIKLHEIAVDGIPLDHLDSWDRIELEPGYRSDVLVKGEPLHEGQESQEYFLIDSPSIPEKSLMGVGEAGHILAKIVVKGSPVNMELPNDSELAAVKMKEAPADILAEEISGSQKIVFGLTCIPENCQQPTKVNFDINGKEFNGEPRNLTLTKAEEWILETGKSVVPSHPFHIHVNPFQYTRLGPDNKPETIWRDTLLVSQNRPEIVKSRYTDFTGTFVLHCHILDHEDQGMMELVQILDESKKITFLPTEENK
ncbi:multicopper oxidase family protein [Anabaena sp. CCY 9910]|uniref:multicopper oxidase family protein n=1 Tax=Anabaena sp. CCY 9910 TaxID=3103870 RepID=UPI0039E013BF